MATTIQALALGGCVVGMAGCEGAAAVASAVAASDGSSDLSGAKSSAVDRVSPDAVEVQRATLRRTPDGCEIDVTFRNVSTRTLDIGFTYELLDSAGQVVTSRGTAVQAMEPGATKTVSSEGTTAGPSGVSCAQVAGLRLKDVGAYRMG